ncbi:MAG: hypothetical protein WCK89_08895 [bacterium]
MTVKKSIKKPVATGARVKKAAPAVSKPAAAAPKKPATAKPVTAAQKKPATAKPLAPQVRRDEALVLDMPASVKKPTFVGPLARTCPLVLDGEVDAADFSATDCLTCGEFDCLFCESRNGSGSLRSRLFAVGEDADEEGDDGWDLDLGEGEEVGDGDEGEGEEEL